MLTILKLFKRFKKTLTKDKVLHKNTNEYNYLIQDISYILKNL